MRWLFVLLAVFLVLGGLAGTSWSAPLKPSEVKKGLRFSTHDKYLVCDQSTHNKLVRNNDFGKAFSIISHGLAVKKCRNIPKGTIATIEKLNSRGACIRSVQTGRGCLWLFRAILTE